MPNKAIKPTVLRESWRPDVASSEKRAKRRRIAQRLGYTGLLGILATFFCFLLFRPFAHPVTRLFFLTSGSYDSLDVQPIPYFQEDALRFLSIDGRFKKADATKEFFLLETPDAFRKSIERVAESALKSSDVALISLSAHPVVVDGRPFLQCSNFDRSTPERGEISLEELLVQLNRITAGTTVLLLDIGHSNSLSIGSLERDRFLFLVRDQLKSSKNSSLWIIASNSPDENSYCLTELRTTVFSYAVQNALKGAADLDGNKAIDLEEFYRYVAGTTQAVVRRDSGGKTNQTPLLFGTGANEDVSLHSRVIASAPNTDLRGLIASLPTGGLSTEENSNETPEKIAEQITQEKEKLQKEKNWLTSFLAEKSTRIKERTIDELSEHMDYFPSDVARKIRKAIGAEADSPTAEQDKEKKLEVSPDSSTTSGSENADTNKGDAREASTSSSAKPVQESGLQAIPDLTRLGDPNETNSQLVRLVWRFCDYLEQPRNSVNRPVDLAPHAWKAFLSYVHGVESRERTDAVVDPKNLRINLTSEIVGSYQFATNNNAMAGSMMKRVASQMPSLDLPKLALPSVGLMEKLAQYGGPPMLSLVSKQIDLLDESTRSESREQHDKWLAQVPNDLPDQYVEFFWPMQFAKRASTPWTITRRLLGLWRRFEQTSYDPLSSNDQVQKDLQKARRLLLQGSRLALDQIGADWLERCVKTLDQAESSLDASTANSNHLRDAMQSRNSRLAELPSLLRCREIAVDRFGTHDLDADIEKTLFSLEKLCGLLIQRESCDLSELTRSHRLLEESANRIQSYWNREASALLAGTSTESVSTSWVVDSLLSTSVVRGQLRYQLIGFPITEPKPSEAAKEFGSKLPTLPRDPLDSADRIQQNRYEVSAARLAGMIIEPSTSTDAIEDGATPSTATNMATNNLEIFYRTLPSQILVGIGGMDNATTSESLSDQLKRLRIADQSLRLLEPVAASTFDAKPWVSKLWRLELLQCVKKKQIDGREYFQDAMPIEIAFLRSSLARLSIGASALSGKQDTSVPKPTRINSRGDSSLSLLVDPKASGEVVWKNVGSPISQAWLLVDFDSEVLELDGPPGIQLYPVHSLPRGLDEARRDAEKGLIEAIAAAATTGNSSEVSPARSRLESLGSNQDYPVHPVPLMNAPSIGIGAGQEFVLPFNVRRIGQGPDQTKIVLKFVGDGEYVRHEITVQLPTSEKLKIHADGPQNGWAYSDEGIVVYPWPNRTTEFRVGLSNASGSPRVFGVEMFSLMERRDIALPDGFLTPEASRQVAERLGETKLIASIPEFSLDATSEIAWLPIQQNSGANDAPANDAPANAATSQDATVTDNAISIRNGIIVVFTDKSTSKKYWRRIDSRVRHPRSYVNPLVSFDSVSERVDIRLRSTQSGAVSNDGIPVRGRVLESLPRGTEMRLEGTIFEKEAAALYCQVPTVGPRDLTFELDVDGFPRAFLFRVPCWRTKTDIPVASDMQRIEIVEPIPGISIGPKATSQPVQIKIDAIAGAFETKRDFVEVGWDLDRDREFANETTIQFSADRQLEVLMTGLLNGRISMKTLVSDIALALPPPSVMNGRVNLLARLRSGGEVIWSKPVEIIADSVRPTIAAVDILPSTSFGQGTDLTIRVGVDDAGLSGVSSVEIVVDAKGIGKFDEAGTPIACERLPDGAWTAKVPTKELLPGRPTMLARATDRVGNQSELAKTSLDVVSAQEWEDRQKRALQELFGSVVYADSPLEEAKVTLENEKGIVVHRTTTDARGMFHLTNIQVGKYKIVAIGVVKNRPRVSQREIEILAPPSPAARIRLLAK